MARIKDFDGRNCPSCNTRMFTDLSMEGTVANRQKCYTALECPRCGATVSGFSRWDDGYGYCPSDETIHFIPGTKTGEEVAEYDRQKAVDAKVIETLTRIGSKFGSAYLLGGAIEELGLFHGEAYTDPDTGEWLCLSTESNFPDSYAEQGWAHPVFIAGWVNESTWTCMVGFGTHHVELFFSDEGELIGVLPDTLPSQRCWGKGSRIQQILDLLD